MTGTNKLKAALWVPRYWPAMGGTELHTRALAHELSSEHDVEIITQCTKSECSVLPLEFDASTATANSYSDGAVQVHKICMHRAVQPFLKFLAKRHRQHRAIRVLYTALYFTSFYKQTTTKTKEFDLIHFVYNGLTDSAMLAAMVAKKQKIPFVFTPNILDTSNQKHAWNSTRFKFLYKSATRIIALTAHEAKWLEEQNVPREKISVIPYGPILEGQADSARFRQTTNIGDAKIVLFLARIIPLKGYKLVLEACAQIWLSHPDARIIFMGPSTPESRNDILQSNDPRILLIEDFDQSMKADALSACDLLCVPSKKESLGVVYIEAAFNAKPVIALDLPVLREVIEHEVDGLLVNDSADCLAKAVVTLLDSPERSIEMGKMGKLKATREFSWTKVRAEISKVYKEVVDEYGTLSKPIQRSTNDRYTRRLDSTKNL